MSAEEGARTDQARKKWRRPKSNAPQAITVTQQDLVSVGQLPQGGSFPRVVQPNTAGLHLSSWAQSNRAFLEAELREHGAILFRGFGLTGEAGFQEYLRATGVGLMAYTEGATPREKLSDKVYTSTEFPAEFDIAPHNELSYVVTWPMRIWFFCVTPPEIGGETPIVNVRNVYRRLDAKIRTTFENKGWMLVRNHCDSFGLSWQSVFHSHDRSEIEEYCRGAEVQCEWISEHHLRTRQVRKAIYRHPHTDDLLWFNHVVFWHVSSLEAKFREAFLAESTEDNLPFNTYYGDGSPIEPSVVAEIRDAYEAESVKFSWQAGDLLMLDNMLTAHGRKAFQGPRRILTAMGMPMSLKAEQTPLSA